MAARKNPTYKVVGGAVVLRLKSGSERYLYRGDIVLREGFDDDSLEHAIGLGLLAEVKAPAVAVEAPDKDAEKDADASAAAE